jgi:hypothetical protein
MFVQDVGKCLCFIQRDAARVQPTPHPTLLGLSYEAGVVGPVGVTRSRPLAQSDHLCLK